MSDLQQQYGLWDEFLSVWPTSRLTTMTLDEYSQAGSKDSFTYWIESGLDELGSIWGGSSFKFGVFSRKDTEDKQSDTKLSYSETHGWYSSLGSTAQEAFEKVRGFVAQVADWAAKGDLDAIESFEHLGRAFKWKIAFHYQNRRSPAIVAIFKPAPLAIFVGSTADQGMATLQKATLARRPDGLGILEFGRQVWAAWSQKNLAICKLSHGGSFTDAERQQCLNDRLAMIARDTGKKQGKKFAEAPLGTLFFLCHGNSPQLVGQFTSTAVDSPDYPDWLQRHYRVLKLAQRTDRYTTNSKGWSPQGNSTFWQVGMHDLPEFEATLLKPFFGTDLAELATLAGEPTGATGQDDDAAQPPIVTPPADDKHNAHCFNRIYYGPPGTGKTYTLMQLLKRDYEQQTASTPTTARVRRYSFVTFHQSYGYEEFVEGLRPVLNGDGKMNEVMYEIRSGAFKELCRKARQAPDQRFAMVIDEINRGNISKIFGELITLIEPDKRDPLDGGKPPIELTLAYSGEKFSVPANVDIIGTMNTADRSLALLDTALRRRFDFVPLLPDTRAAQAPNEPYSAPLAGLVVASDAGDIDVRRMLERINERIEALYDRDHCIGHAYFTHLKEIANGAARFDALADTFHNRILPLLEEYFFEDWHKIRLVLGDNQKPDAAQFITESGVHEHELSGLFSDDHGLDSYAAKRRYQPQPSAFANPAAYFGIYQPSS